MLKKFRRNSKAKIPSKPQDPAQSATLATQQPKQTTFYSLPAELRNEIYTLAALSCTLHLFSPLHQKTKPKLKPIPALLLASHQTRSEYLPILLSTAEIKASITDFNFKDLQRVLSSLYSSELKALRSNARLTIFLRLRKCSDEAYAGLRRWCVARAEGLDRVGWRYRLGEGVDGVVLRWYAERVRVLYERVEGEGVKWEVRRISETLEGDVGPWMRSVVRTGAAIALEREQAGEGWVSGFGDDSVMMAAIRKRRG